MKYKIESSQNKLKIFIKSKAEERETLLSNFEVCQKGQCSCPTDEYKKLQSLNISSLGDELILNLESKPNQVFNVNEIKKCLDFTANKLKKE
jgi:hypothetical protein